MLAEILMAVRPESEPMSRIDEARPFIPLNIAVLTVSDTRTPETDRSGDTLVNRLEAAGASTGRACHRARRCRCDPGARLGLDRLAIGRCRADDRRHRLYRARCDA